MNGNDILAPTYFSSITQILHWSGGYISYLGEGTDYPYTKRNGKFYYFAFDGEKYNLQMESGIDLNERKV